jgi:hypothetical protein
LGPRVHVVEKEGKMAAQEQAKVSQHSLLSQQSVKEPSDVESAPVDEAATGTVDVVLATLDLLENLPGRRGVILFGGLDMGGSGLYIAAVREPCLMPNVGWERWRLACW